MEYKTWAPNLSLAHFIKCFWTLEAPANVSQERQRIVPDGCMEMIFHYGDLFYQYLEDGTKVTQPRSFVFGQITKPLEIGPSGKTGVIAARFHPDGFIPFSTMEIKAMDNCAVSLWELYGEQGNVLEQDVLSSTATAERIEKIEIFLLSKLRSPKGIDALAKSSVDLLLQSKGQVTIDSLAEQLKSNRRQLERKFVTTIGLSPKQLSKIVRLQSTLKMIEQKNFKSLTALAHEGGYFDQAHFIKDFKEFTGLSPKQFYASNLIMSALFIGTE
jgi:AraC-like DNA-binding protein